MISQPIFSRCLPDLAEGDCVLSVLNTAVKSSVKDYSTYGNDANSNTDLSWQEVGAYFNGSTSKMGFANDAELNLSTLLKL